MTPPGYWSIPGPPVPERFLALDRFSSQAPAGDAAASHVAPGATTSQPELRPLSRVMAMSLVVIAALVWWESRLLA